jgi:6-phosphogluconolactonase (cycloisomerase 2 family)
MRRLGLLGLMVAVLVCLPASASATNLYVGSQVNNSIDAFHVASDGSLTPIACSGSNCTAGGGTEQLVITPDNQFLYSVNADANTVSEFSMASDGSLTQLCSSSCPATGSTPIGMTVSPNGKFAYAANQTDAGTVSPFSVGSDGSLTSIACPGSNCSTDGEADGIAMSPNGNYLYTTNQGSDTISEFSVGSDGSPTPLCTSACPAVTSAADLLPVAVSPNGKFLYAAGRDNGEVYPFQINSDGTLTPIACATCGSTSENLNGLAVTPNGKFLYTANEDSDSISAFSINSDGTLTPISCSACAAGSNAYAALTVEPGSRYLYALTVGDGGNSTLVPFSINADGSLTPISCAPADCDTSESRVDVFSIVATPDQAPVAKFTHSPGHAGQATKFNGSGSTAYQNATVAVYDWSFGDGKSAPNGGPTPKHKFAKPGRYKVTLTVTDSLGCSTQQTYTGQTMSCNGSSVATITHTVHVTAVKKARLSLSGLPSVCVRAVHTIGVHVHTASGSAPHKTSVSVDGHRVARSRKLSFSVTVSLGALKVGSNTIKAASVDRFGRHSSVSAHITRCSTSAAFTG